MPRTSATAPSTQSLDGPIVIGPTALAWVVHNPDQLNRLMGLTGLSPDELRARADDPGLLAAVLGLLEAHEPDLIACAEAIGHTPGELVAARERLER